MSAVSKLIVFGATGQTGLCSIDAALKKGLLSWFLLPISIDFVDEMRFVCYITCHLAIDSFTAN